MARNFSRRDFFKWTAHLGLASSGLLCPASSFAKFFKKAKTQDARSSVVIVRRPAAQVGKLKISQDLVDQMLNHGICSLTGLSDPTAAWSSLFAPGETIGIKVNALGGRRICTHPKIAYAVAANLINAGIPPENIIIWDRLSTELKRGGYTLQKGGTAIQCFGTDSDYELQPEISGSIGSCFSRILTRYCNAVISMPVLKDHDLSGVSLNLKNFYGAIHNPNKYHDNGCDPFIADLNNHPAIKNKLRLIICDGLSGQYNGGPAFKSQWTWPYGGLLLSRDPVAVDRVGTQLIEEQRKIKGLPTLAAAGRKPRHIQTAADKNLGIADIKKIYIIDS